jgi:hypothetical protein
MQAEAKLQKLESVFENPSNDSEPNESTIESSTKGGLT